MSDHDNYPGFDDVDEPDNHEEPNSQAMSPVIGAEQFDVNEMHLEAVTSFQVCLSCCFKIRWNALQYISWLLSMLHMLQSQSQSSLSA